MTREEIERKIAERLRTTWHHDCNGTVSELLDERFRSAWFSVAREVTAMMERVALTERSECFVAVENCESLLDRMASVGRTPYQRAADEIATRGPVDFRPAVVDPSPAVEEES